jgi:hypothetical protein
MTSLHTAPPHYYHADPDVIFYIMAVGIRKAVNDRLYLSKANGGGILRREIWVDGQDRIVRYNLAYINPLIYAGDNGRVVVYDSAHGHHHRHYKGNVAVVGLSSFEQIEAQFQEEWTRLAKEVRHAKN